ncbi:unnamed protein product, partial [Ectocarpus sp. 8 AP-2014]
DARVPIKNLTRALSLCLENKAVYNYPVLREALNVMSQVPTAGQNGGGVKQIPLLLMRTVMVSVATFPELKNFVATVVLVRLVQQQVWTSDGLWKGFLRCAKMMAKESGATSFIAMVQLPEKKLKEALANPLMKVWPRLFRTQPSAVTYTRGVVFYFGEKPRGAACCQQ